MIRNLTIMVLVLDALLSGCRVRIPDSTQYQLAHATLSGVITAGGYPVSDAAVTITEMTSGAEINVTTNKKGRYWAANLDAGSYVITVQYKDFPHKVDHAVLGIGVQGQVVDIDILPVGETVFGVIRGSVTDNMGAALGGAHITITELRSLRTISPREPDVSAAVHKTDTDTAGGYKQAELEPGEYSISVVAEGFRGPKKKGAKLDIRQAVTRDFKLSRSKK